MAPASTLHNWQQEITRFVPGLKALPYWGNVKDRATLRKFWSKKDITYNRDAPFHVLITSYQLVIQGFLLFRAIIVDVLTGYSRPTVFSASQVAIYDSRRGTEHQEFSKCAMENAPRIPMSKSPATDRNSDPKFNARYVLSIHKSMIVWSRISELWALLHFIMPSLFDSHDEFNEWFSKDIENAAENKGSKLNEHQLRRLHMILKPFMLRRVKRHVQNELSEKVMFLLLYNQRFLLTIRE